MAHAPGPQSLAGLARPGDTVHLELVDAAGFVWSYPSRVVWTAPQRLALTLPSDPRWRPLLLPGGRLQATLLAGDAAASASLVIQGISVDPPPLLLVGPARPERSRLATTPLLDALPQPH